MLLLLNINNVIISGHPGLSICNYYEKLGFCMFIFLLILFCICLPEDITLH